MRSLLLSLPCLVALACTGNPGPDDPGNANDNALLEDSTQPGEAAPASSAKVQAGVDAIQAKDYAKAKQLLSEAAAENPNDPQAAFYLAVTLEATGDMPGATENYRRALKLDPKLPEASQNLSAILLESGDAKGALAIVESGLKHTPNHPGLLMNHALALEATGDAAAALAAYGKAAAAQPDNLELSYTYGELLAQAGKKDPALKELGKVMVSDDPKVLAAAANVFGKLGAFGECVAALDKAIEKAGKSKESAGLYVRRGVCRHEMKDEPGAKKDYDQALALDADFAPAHYYIGMHQRAAGKKKEAIAAFQKAATLAGDQGVGPGAKKALEELGAGKPKGK